MTYKIEELDKVVLDIEFLLISVIQGVALTTLSLAAVGPISNFQVEYFPYIFSGFLFILIFWSGAIIHALSFIDWPLDLNHTFLYFLASFIEVLTFNQVTNPVRWFIFTVLFFLVAGVLYITDFQMIKMRQKKFEKNTQTKKLYEHMYARQKFELFLLVPAGLVANALAVFVFVLNTNFFISHHWHVVIAIGQALFSLGLLFNSIINFRQRSKLISDCL